MIAAQHWFASTLCYTEPFNLQNQTETVFQGKECFMIQYSWLMKDTNLKRFCKACTKFPCSIPQRNLNHTKHKKMHGIVSKSWCTPFLQDHSNGEEIDKQISFPAKAELQSNFICANVVAFKNLSWRKLAATFTCFF